MRLPAKRWLAYICVPFFVLFASISAASAQTYTFGQATLPTGVVLPSAVATADLNGDGKLDLVVTSLQNSTVTVFMGQPDGSFTATFSSATGFNPSALLLADINGDGNLDIVVANENCVFFGHVGITACEDGSVSILLGNGDGTFQPHQDFLTAPTPTSVQVADMNGDGKLDLIVGCNPAIGDPAPVSSPINTVSVLLGNGDGTFQTHVDYFPPSGAARSSTRAWVAVADFNGDGKPDVATGYFLPPLNDGTIPPAVAIFLGNGDGTLRSPLSVQLPDGPGSTPVGFAVAADFNGDGKQDLAVLGATLLGNGDGTFTPIGSVSGGSGQIVAIDLNQDGKLDFVGVGPSGIYTVLGNGDGTFQFDTESVMPTASGTTGVAVGDFNGDGRLDVLAAVANTGFVFAVPPINSPLPGSLGIFLGQGGGAFGGSVLSSPAGAANFVPTGLIAADLNGDGKLDLAFVNTGQPGSSIDDTASVLLGKGDGTFQPQQTFATGAFPVDLQIADFDGDGKPDLAVVNQICALTATNCSAGSVSILLNNGDGTFKPHQDFGVGITPTGLTVGNFTGNGKPGVAVPNFALGQGTNISVLTGKGDGTLNTQVQYTTPGAPTAIASGDFNNDGKTDVVVTSLRNSSPTAPASSAPEVSTFFGSGDGTFQQPIQSTILTAGVLPSGPELVSTDYNEDGKLDLATAHISSVGWNLFPGHGDGTFSTSGDSEASPTSFFALGDFNGDGHVDLAVYTTPVNGGNNFGIYQGDGQGDFQLAQLFPYGLDLSHRVVVSGDFNGDGGLDLAFVQGPNVVVLLNEAFKSVYPTSLSFGSVGLTTQSPTQAVTIHNPSGTPFHISNISASSPFGETNNCGATLSPQATCTVNVHFSPSSEGTASGALTLTDSTHASPQVIPLTGSGVDGPYLQLSPTHLYLGSANVGSTNGPQTIVLSNTGNTSLTITNIGISGGNAGDFTQSNTCGNGLAVGAMCNVSVTFTPSAGGARATTLTIADGAPGSPHRVNLTGSGPAAPGPLVVSPTSLAFGTQSVGQATPPQTVTVTNTGSTSVTLSTITLSGDFIQGNNCGTIAATASCRISVAFAPRTAGNAGGILTVVPELGSSQTVALTGTGADFSVSTGGGSGSGSGSSATVTAGATATYPMSLVAGPGFSGTIALACSGAPTDSTCSISPSSVTLGGVTPFLTTVSVTTTARSSLLAPFVEKPEFGSRRKLLFPAVSAVFAALLALLLFNLSAARRRRFAWAPLATLSSVMAITTLAMAGCGGGGSSGSPVGPTTPTGGTGTAAGNYTITVTATAGSGANAVSHTIKLALTVQ
jgi:FG-GAP-like repeat/Abnormal spindle-like microcephaly-assoc'd, ASPM-SPD-2-Hydin